MKKTFLTLLIFTQTYFITYSQDRCKVLNRFKAPDSVKIQYNARTGVASPYPIYRVNQNGYIIFEIMDINLFRYSVTLTEIQKNIINSTKLSEGNTQISVNPTVFNLTDLNLKIQIAPVTPNDATKELAKIEKKKIDQERKIERKKQEIEKEEATYLVTKRRIDKINEIDVKILMINSTLNYLDTVNKG